MDILSTLFIPDISSIISEYYQPSYLFYVIKNPDTFLCMCLNLDSYSVDHIFKIPTQILSINTSNKYIYIRTQEKFYIYDLKTMKFLGNNLFEIDPTYVGDFIVDRNDNIYILKFNPENGKLIINIIKNGKIQVIKCSYKSDIRKLHLLNDQLAIEYEDSSLHFINGSFLPLKDVLKIVCSGSYMFVGYESTKLEIYEIKGNEIKRLEYENYGVLDFEVLGDLICIIQEGTIMTENYKTLKYTQKINTGRWGNDQKYKIVVRDNITFIFDQLNSLLSYRIPDQEDYTTTENIINIF